MMRLDIRAATCCLLLAAPIASMAADCRPRRDVDYSLAGDGVNEIPVKQNLPVGALIKEVSMPGDGTIVAAVCSGLTVIDRAYVGLSASEVPDVYRSPLAGVGIKIEWTSPEGNRSAFPFRTEVEQDDTYDIANTGVITVGFYRIAGDFTGGVISPGAPLQVARVNVDTINAMRVLMTNVAFRQSTCSITTRSLNQTVTLGRHTARDFTDGAGPWRDFSLESETCDLDNFSEARFTFSGETPDGYPNLFAIDSGATAARGVAVQLKVRDGELIEPEQLVTTPAVAEGARYDFQARYMRTRDALGSGVGNSTITVNVTYD